MSGPAAIVSRSSTFRLRPSTPSSTPTVPKIWLKRSACWPSHRSRRCRQSPHMHLAFASADLLLAAINEAEQLLAEDAGLDMRDLDDLLADGDAGVERAGQPLQRARHVRRMADDGERKRALAADGAHDDWAEVHADARVDGLRSGGNAGLVPIAQAADHLARAVERDHRF